MPDGLRRRLAAVMFTDMAGYTALMRKDEAAALLARQRHRRALEDSLAGRSGEVLQYFGDGSLSIFASTVHAVDAAMDIQQRLAGDPSLRIGLHAGEVAYDVQGAYGDAVNIAARLEALCPPGGVTISHKVYDELRAHPRIAVVSLGSVRLKNVDEAVPIYALAVGGLTLPGAAWAADPPDDEGPTESLPGIVTRRLDELRGLDADPLRGVGAVPGRIPMVGRERELEEIAASLDRAEEGHSSALFVRGPRGVGKTRLTQELGRMARDRGWTVLRGRAHPSERLLPYGPFADALLPLLRGLDADCLAGLTPGSGAALCSLFPALGATPEPLAAGSTEPGESRTRLYWQFAGFLEDLAAHRPLLIVLEDLDFTDRASLDLLEAVARQLRHAPIVFLAEYAGTDPERTRWLRSLEQSLVARGRGRVLDLEPLDEQAATMFVRHAFDLEPAEAERLTRLAFTWSQGNPFFLTGTLHGLVEAGALRRIDGRWSVEDVEAMPLPHSIRDAVLVWTSRLSEVALDLVRSLAIIGRQASYEVLREVSGLDDETLTRALDDLVRSQIVLESESRWTLVYAFRNPILREILRSELPLATRRQLHSRVGRTLEDYYGRARDDHAEELAYHYGRAHDRASAAKAIRYLTLAGRTALMGQANREAAEYLSEALERLDAGSPTPAIEGDGIGWYGAVLRDLARARRRLGDTSGSIAMWRRMGAAAREADHPPSIARVHLELGLTFWGDGALEEAMEEFASAQIAADEAGEDLVAVRAQLALSLCCQYVGDVEGAERLIDESLRRAEKLAEPAILGRVHRARIQHNLWTGKVAEAREAADAALELCRIREDRGVEFWSRWALGALEGLMGNTREMAVHVGAAQRLAERVGSPFFDVATGELAVELRYARGEWEEALRIGHGAIELARATEQRLVLPRLLVWVSLIHLAQGDTERAEALTHEAWRTSRADGADGRGSFVDLHAVVPAHIGRASVHLARGEWEQAVRVAEAGLRIADRSGYVVWAIHHVLPIIGEASIHARDLERAAAIGDRMRQEAERLGHALGLAWADACDAILTWLRTDAAEGVRSLRRGAEAMERIPMVFEAARLRRQLAGRLAEVGDREGALVELRRAYEVFQRLGARPELEKARGQFAELGSVAP